MLIFTFILGLSLLGQYRSKPPHDLQFSTFQSSYIQLSNNTGKDIKSISLSMEEVLSLGLGNSKKDVLNKLDKMYLNPKAVDATTTQLTNQVVILEDMNFLRSYLYFDDNDKLNSIQFIMYVIVGEKKWEKKYFEHFNTLFNEKYGKKLKGYSTPVYKTPTHELIILEYISHPENQFGYSFVLTIEKEEN